MSLFLKDFNGVVRFFPKFFFHLSFGHCALILDLNSGGSQPNFVRGGRPSKPEMTFLKKIINLDLFFEKSQD